MSYLNQDQAPFDPTFRVQVRQALLIQAVAVSGEGSSAANHAARSQLAVSVLNQLTDDRLALFCRVVAGDGATLPGSTDSAVLARVSAVWNALAGGT